MNYKEEILKDLIDIYERRDASSSNFTKPIRIRLDKKKYNKYFVNIHEYNEALIELEKSGFININIMKYDTVFESFDLNIEKVIEIKELLGIRGIDEQRRKLFETLDRYNDDILIDLKNKIKNKKSIRSYLGEDYIDAIKVVHYMENLNQDIFERNASNHLFNDSKRISKLKIIIQNIYGSDESIFIEKGILSVPSYLYVKGQGKIVINDEIFNLSKIKYSVGISLQDIDSINFQEITKVTTIENLTTFYNYKGGGLIIYLGGFSNRIRGKILKKITYVTDNFYHFGDIDYGGFAILNNLMNQLNINIKAVNMDVETLIKYAQFTQKITDNEYIKRLSTLLEKNNLSPYFPVIEYMISNKIRLEQESIYNN